MDLGISHDISVSVVSYVGWGMSVLGWVIIYFLNIRTLNRGEISRHRDGVLNQITELVSWFNDIGYGTAEYKNNEFEELLSAKVSQVEFKINNLNSFIGLKLIDPSNLAKLEFDSSAAEKSCEASKRLIFEAYNLLEEIEINLNNYLENKTSFIRFYIRYKVEVQSVSFSITLVALWYFIFFTC
jgi:hypothetical protein